MQIYWLDYQRVGKCPWGRTEAYGDLHVELPTAMDPDSRVKTVKTRHGHEARRIGFDQLCTLD